MKPVDFRYVRPDTVAGAVRALADAPDARVLAGGQSLGPLLNMRLARPGLLVDVNAIPELGALEERADSVRIGATVRQRDVERSAIVARRLPLLHAALPHVGHAHTRNRGTVVGSIVHADPAAEVPLVAVLLDAVLERCSSSSGRAAPASSPLPTRCSGISRPRSWMTKSPLRCGFPPRRLRRACDAAPRSSKRRAATATSRSSEPLPTSTFGRDARSTYGLA
jgi:CO/xanthine dehydrogenase FAD-binding subunit